MHDQRDLQEKPFLVFSVLDRFIYTSKPSKPRGFFLSFFFKDGRTER